MAGLLLTFVALVCVRSGFKVCDIRGNDAVLNCCFKQAMQRHLYNSNCISRQMFATGSFLIGLSPQKQPDCLSSELSNFEIP